MKTQTSSLQRHIHVEKSENSSSGLIGTVHQQRCCILTPPSTGLSVTMFSTPSRPTKKNEGRPMTSSLKVTLPPSTDKETHIKLFWLFVFI